MFFDSQYVYQNVYPFFRTLNEINHQVLFKGVESTRHEPMELTVPRPELDIAFRYG